MVCIRVSSHSTATESIVTLRLVRFRVKDKKVLVRHAALSGLSTLYQTYCAPFPRSHISDSVTEKYGWIPSTLLGLYRVDQDNRAMVAKCIEEICLVPQTSDRCPSAVAHDFWCALDARGKESMVSMLKVFSSTI